MHAQPFPFLPLSLNVAGGGCSQSRSLFHFHLRSFSLSRGEHTFYNTFFRSFPSPACHLPTCHIFPPLHFPPYICVDREENWSFPSKKRFFFIPLCIYVCVCGFWRVSAQMLLFPHPACLEVWIACFMIFSLPDPIDTDTGDLVISAEG